MAVMNARSVKIWVTAWSRNSSHSVTSREKNTETVNQTTTTVIKARTGTLLGVRLTISSSTANRKEMMRTRTLTSHASHDRSLNFVSPIRNALQSYPASLAIMENIGRYSEM